MKENSFDIPAPVTPTQPESTASTREPAGQRKVAHFFNNFVILPKGSRLHEDDELEVRNRLFVLKRKKFSPGLILGLASPIFLILVVLAVSMFVGGDTGNGRVIGVVVDDYGVPYDGGATIRFPELDKSFTTDVQGFFATDRLPAGSHKLEYVVAGTVVGEGYATVVDDDITKLLVTPSMPEKTKVSDLPSPVPAKTDYSAPPKMAQQEAPPSSSISSPKEKETSVRNAVESAKLVLDANVDGATLKLDGQTLGVGNTTYTKITPGTRNYAVSRKGFETVSGTIKLTSGGRETLKVTLKPISEAARAEVYSAEDYYYAAQEALSKGKYPAAIADFGHAIDADPGYADAYQARAEAQLKTGAKKEAYQDLLRAGEIYQIHRDFGNATSSFSKAIELFPNAIEPVLGRGHTYLARGENIAAIADFETAVDIDKNSPAAQFGLGVARFNHGQYKQAIDAFKKARSLDEGDPATHQYLMLAYMARNDTKNVKKSYNEFVKNVSEEEVTALHNDKRFTAIVRVVDMED